MSKRNKEKTEIANGYAKYNVLLEILLIYYISDVSMRVIPERRWKNWFVECRGRIVFKILIRAIYVHMLIPSFLITLLSIMEAEYTISSLYIVHSWQQLSVPQLPIKHYTDQVQYTPRCRH
jgi:hypothetical protein